MAPFGGSLVGSISGGGLKAQPDPTFSDFGGQPAVLTGEFIRHQQELHLRRRHLWGSRGIYQAFPQRHIQLHLDRAGLQHPAGIIAFDADPTAIGKRGFGAL